MKLTEVFHLYDIEVKLIFQNLLNRVLKFEIISLLRNKPDFKGTLKKKLIFKRKILSFLFSCCWYILTSNLKKRTVFNYAVRFNFSLLFQDTDSCLICKRKKNTMNIIPKHFFRIKWSEIKMRIRMIYWAWNLRSENHRTIPFDVKLKSKSFSKIYRVQIF